VAEGADLTTIIYDLLLMIDEWRFKDKRQKSQDKNYGFKLKAIRVQYQRSYDQGNFDFSIYISLYHYISI
jgi:hypothetical protein